VDIKKEKVPRLYVKVIEDMTYEGTTMTREKSICGETNQFSVKVGIPEFRVEPLPVLLSNG